jgi:hypothetical protein
MILFVPKPTGHLVRESVKGVPDRLHVGVSEFRKLARCQFIRSGNVAVIFNVAFTQVLVPSRMNINFSYQADRTPHTLMRGMPIVTEFTGSFL